MHFQYLVPPDSEIVPSEWMGEVKSCPLVEMDVVVDTMGHNKVESKIEIKYGNADPVDCVWEFVCNASEACTSEDSDITSKGW